ncbi:hypothetical protein [Moraxella lacunata]
MTLPKSPKTCEYWGHILRRFCKIMMIKLPCFGVIWYC